jgi:hypothetical protein
LATGCAGESSTVSTGEHDSVTRCRRHPVGRWCRGEVDDRAACRVFTVASAHVGDGDDRAVYRHAAGVAVDDAPAEPGHLAESHPGRRGEVDVWATAGAVISTVGKSAIWRALQVAGPRPTRCTGSQGDGALTGEGAERAYSRVARAPTLELWHVLHCIPTLGPRTLGPHPGAHKHGGHSNCCGGSRSVRSSALSSGA